MIPTKEQIAAFEKDNLVSVRPHSTLPLRIVNYTPKAQYDRAWTPQLLQCRGLIFDHDWNLVARPLPKFFNYEEHYGENPVAGPLPVGRFIATDKMDGSLGILFNYKGHIGIATRGSFHSEQAERANDILFKQFDRKTLEALTPGFTHLFEIIYPQNRIVVDYGAREELVYLTSFQNDSGWELDQSKVFGGVPLLALHDTEPLIFTAPRKNAEGYVLRYESGQRVKIKHEEYVNLHRIVTGLSSTSVWDHLAAGGTIEALLDPLPDEWMKWARKEAEKILAHFNDLATKAAIDFNEITSDTTIGDDPKLMRKAFAAKAKKTSNPSLMFLLLDGDRERLNALIWRLVKPERRTPITGVEC